MRRNYAYAITLLLISFFLWFGYYFYMETRPVVYKNGTLVEVPMEFFEKKWELSA